MPKAYITNAFDVLSGTSKNITLQNEHTQLVDALGFVDSLEKNSLTLYDRLYFSQSLYRAHFKRGNYFLMRCRSNANEPVSDFFADPNAMASSMKVTTEECGEENTIWFIKEKTVTMVPSVSLLTTSLDAFVMRALSTNSTA